MASLPTSVYVAENGPINGGMGVDDRRRQSVSANQHGRVLNPYIDFYARSGFIVFS